MDILSTGQLLAQLRKKRGISQAELARRASIPAYRLSRIEHDKARPSDEEARELARRLGEDPTRLLSPELRHPRQSSLLRPFKSRPKRLALTSEVSLDTWRGRFGLLAHQFEMAVCRRADAALCREYLRQCGAESADELQLSFQLLSREQVIPVWTTAARCGFTTHPVVERKTGASAANLVRPALHVSHEDVVALMFPQVSLRPARSQFRVDFLVGLKRSGGIAWIDLEIDGGGHDPSYDEYRRETLGLPTVRISGSEVGRRDCFDILMRRLRRV